MLRFRGGTGCTLLLGCPLENSFDSKQPKLEPKPVSALCERKRCFKRFASISNTEVRCFDSTGTNRKKLKQTEATTMF
jgi:hypothetical protein